MNNQYILYGAAPSLYSGKVRAYLQYKGIPYKETTASMSVYKKIIMPNTGVAMIPVIQTPDQEFWQDSSIILDRFEERFSQKAIMPSSPKQRILALLFELWGDEWLRLPAMHYRWNFPEANSAFISAEFGATAAPSMPSFIQRWLGRKAIAKFSAYVEPLGINQHTIPEIEAWYEELLSQLNTLFSRQDFLFGSCPSIADFGLLGPLYAHLGRDPYPKQLMEKKAPQLMQWVKRMNNAADIRGEFTADDEIAPELELILARLFKEFWPALLSSCEQLSQWAQGKAANSPVPRKLGMQDFQIGTARGTQMSLSYGQWMLQRLLAHYKALSPEQQQEVGRYLAQYHQGVNPLDMSLAHTVAFRNYRLVLASGSDD